MYREVGLKWKYLTACFCLKYFLAKQKLTQFSLATKYFKVCKNRSNCDKNVKKYTISKT